MYRDCDSIHKIIHPILGRQNTCTGVCEVCIISASLACGILLKMVIESSSGMHPPKGHPTHDSEFMHMLAALDGFSGFKIKNKRRT